MILLILAAALAAIFLLSSILAAKALYPKTYSLESTFRIEAERGRIDPEEYLRWERREIELPSPWGYAMRATYLPLEGSRRTVILVHGIRYSRYGSIKYALPFRRRGFNALLIDLRRHGETGGTTCGFGHFEREDLAAWFEWALAELGPGGLVGTHGESLGAAVALLHAAQEPRLAFAVADCAYSDLREELAFRLRASYRLPAFPFLPLANLASHALAGFGFEEVSPIREILSVSAPLLFIHGEADDYTPPAMSRTLYGAVRTRGYAELYLVPGAGHARSLETDPLEYDRRIGSFLESVGILKPDGPCPG